MTTLSHEEHRSARLLVPELWAALAISVMWLAVLLSGVWGPDFVSRSPGNETVVPTVIPVAFFAYLGTRIVARYGFRRDDEP